MFGIIQSIKVREQGIVNQALRELKEKVDEFLNIYEEDGNKEVDVEELIAKREQLDQDLNGKLNQIVKSIKYLEKEVINYQQGVSSEAKVEETEQKNQIFSTENQKQAGVKKIPSKFTICNICRVLSNVKEHILGKKEIRQNQQQAQIIQQQPFGMPSSSKPK